MPLVDQPFADTFAFSRGDTGAYRAAGGVEQAAGVNVPRFDHDADGAPLGLLVEGRPLRWSPDRLSVQDGDWAVLRGTVLHEFVPPGGTVERRAWYAPLEPVAAVDAPHRPPSGDCLSADPVAQPWRPRPLGPPRLDPGWPDPGGGGRRPGPDR